MLHTRKLNFQNKSLNYGLKFSDLNSICGIKKLDDIWLTHLKINYSDLYKEFLFARESGHSLNSKQYSDLLINIAPVIDDFLIKLFNKSSSSNNAQKIKEFVIIYECKRNFIQRVAIRKYTIDKLENIDIDSISEKLRYLLTKKYESHFSEIDLAIHILKWNLQPEFYSNELDLAAQYTAYMVYNNKNHILYKIPKQINEQNNIRNHRIEELRSELYLGYDCRDNQITLENSINNAKYCIYCHNQHKQSCSLGFKITHPEKLLLHNKTGCPLKQKISEMNFVKTHGFDVAALAIIMIDNPLVAMTGHRICNDCIKSCIYQKQDAVDIPVVESEILNSVLNLPYGVEIYLLLTKWNPLNIVDYMPEQFTNYNILIAGLGPAGIALSHYLLNKGHNVFAIDGLEIAPLEIDSSKIIKYWSKLNLPLNLKKSRGFGGVAEYGITHRWNKNLLLLLRLMLERRSNFKLYGSVLLNSNITINQAFELGFDHISLCVGASSPLFLIDKSFFKKYIYAATNFLTYIHKETPYIGGAKLNFIIRFPVIIIGCGLTSIDSAVEIFHYYPIQVENFLSKYENDIKLYGKDSIESLWNAEYKSIASEFIIHGEEFRKMKTDSEKISFMKKCGGVTICARSKIIDSSAYKLNVEEIEHAIAIGIDFLEDKVPSEVIEDEFNFEYNVKFIDKKILKAKTILVAIGMEHNDIEQFLKNGKYEREGDYELLRCESAINCFLNVQKTISHFGDCNKSYKGSVVKAIASVKENFKILDQVIRDRHHQNLDYEKFKDILDDFLIAKIVKTEFLTEKIKKITIYGPGISKNFLPGQFCKLKLSDIGKLNSCSVPITIYDAEKANKIFSIITNCDNRFDNNICGNLVQLMGPIGKSLPEIKNQNVILVGENIANSVLFSIAKYLKKNNCKINYFAKYDEIDDIFHLENIYSNSDYVYLCSSFDIKNLMPTADLCKIYLYNDIVDAFDNFNKFAKNFVSYIICSGSSKFVSKIKNVKDSIFKESKLICYQGSKMQCMMGLCGRCIIKSDNEKGYSFSCISHYSEYV